MKKNCTNYHAWRAKKGNFSLICEEVNSVSVSIDTWWIDSGATTHISVSMQGCRNYRKPRDGERYIYVGDVNKAEVEAIWHFRLLMKTGLYLNLYAANLLRENLDPIWTCTLLYGRPYIYAEILLILRQHSFPHFLSPFHFQHIKISLSLNIVPEEKKLSTPVLSITLLD
jgi:hypothetical protein